MHLLYVTLERSRDLYRITENKTSWHLILIHSFRFQQQNRSRQSSPPHIFRNDGRSDIPSGRNAYVFIIRFNVKLIVTRSTFVPVKTKSVANPAFRTSPSPTMIVRVGLYVSLFLYWRETASQRINWLRSHAFQHQRWRFPRTNWFSSSRRTQSSGYRASTWECGSLYRGMCVDGDKVAIWECVEVVESFGDLGVC